MRSNTAANPYTPPQAIVDDAFVGTDSTFTLNLFSSQGRIGRVRYLTYSFGLSILCFIVAGVVAALTGPLALGLGYATVFYLHIMLAIKRSHDFNTSGWLSLLVFVPIINLAFLFIPGTDGPNRFGNKTAPNGSAGVVLIGLIVGVAVLGILAAIAIPSYQNYLHRAKAVQAH